MVALWSLGDLDVHLRTRLRQHVTRLDVVELGDGDDVPCAGTVDR